VNLLLGTNNLLFRGAPKGQNEIIRLVFLIKLFFSLESMETSIIASDTLQEPMEQGTRVPTETVMLVNELQTENPEVFQAVHAEAPLPQEVVSENHPLEQSTQNEPPMQVSIEIQPPTETPNLQESNLPSQDSAMPETQEIFEEKGTEDLNENSHEIHFMTIDGNACSLAPQLSFSPLVSTFLNRLVETNILREGDFSVETLQEIAAASPAVSLEALKEYETLDFSVISDKNARFKKLVDSILTHKDIFVNGHEENLKKLLQRTGYSLLVGHGYRQYGGPPPNWTSNAPDPTVCQAGDIVLIGNRQVYVGKIPEDAFEDEFLPVMEQFGPIFDVRLMMTPDRTKARPIIGWV
jgi:hypothetical protein